MTTGDALELWLGEVKFFQNIQQAIAAVVAELQDHTNRDYLRSEFSVIKNKVDPAWAFSDRLKKLIHPQKSLDEIFDAVVVPVLLTYDSDTVKNHTRVTTAFQDAFEKEVMKHRDTFAAKKLPDNVRIELFLFPLASKATLVEEFDERLKKWQALG